MNYFVVIRYPYEGLSVDEHSLLEDANKQIDYLNSREKDDYGPSFLALIKGEVISGKL